MQLFPLHEVLLPCFIWGLASVTWTMQTWYMYLVHYSSIWQTCSYSATLSERPTSAGSIFKCSKPVSYHVWVQKWTSMLIHQVSTVMAFATFELPTLNVHVTCSLRTPLQKVYCCLVALSSRFVTHVHVVYCAIFAIANYYCFVPCSVSVHGTLGWTCVNV